MTETLIFHNIAQLVTVQSPETSPENPLGIIEDGALVVEDGLIAWVGRSDALDSSQYPMARRIDARGKTLTPGLIDSHTHTVFAGDRANEFEMRLAGKTYLEIAQAGGGIAKTVEATRQASAQELYDLTLARLQRMAGFGVTTVEVKSGYGLSFESERKCLEVIRQLRQDQPVNLVATFMGAHDIPPEYKNQTDAYVDQVCEKQIPVIAAEGLAEFCDVFCETGYFSVAQARRVLETAWNHGMKLKIHAEEFTDIGGAVLAGELGAASADHLLHISEAGIAALKAGGTVATLLPGTAFYLRLKDYAPARKLLDAGVPVALATDFNPGSCAIENLQLIMSLACLQMGMLPTEVLRAVTHNAAMALDCHHDRGSLSVGKRADLVLWDVASYHEILYRVGVNLVASVYVAGQPVVA